MDTRSFLIGILSVTATILFSAVIILTAVQPQSVQAAGQNAIVGDYVIATGQYQASTELIYVIDTAVEKLNVYELDHSRKRFSLASSTSLKRN